MVLFGLVFLICFCFRLRFFVLALLRYSLVPFSLLFSSLVALIFFLSLLGDLLLSRGPRIDMRRNAMFSRVFDG